MPESMIATRTGGSARASALVSQKSKARVAVRCHCLAASGSFGTNATRRVAEPLDVDSAGQVGQPRRRRLLDDERGNRREALGFR